MTLIEFTDNHEENVKKVIEGCRMLITSMCDTSKQPLEREAGYVLAQMLHLQAESMGLLNHPDVKRFFDMQRRYALPVRRYPQDFVDGFSAAAAD